MAVTKRDLEEWMNTMENDTLIGVDDGGLSLVNCDNGEWLEIGGVPEEEADDPWKEDK